MYIQLKYTGVKINKVNTRLPPEKWYSASIENTNRAMHFLSLIGTGLMHCKIRKT